jgi:hypothetical protein
VPLVYWSTTIEGKINHQKIISYMEFNSNGLGDNLIATRT